MSKQIRVSDPTYLRLETVREKRETFSQVIDRLLEVYLQIKNIKDTLGPSHYLRERPILDARSTLTIGADGQIHELPKKPL
jgi:hypothetical protein